MPSASQLKYVDESQPGPILVPSAAPTRVSAGRQVSRVWIAQQLARIGARQLGATLLTLKMTGAFARGQAVDIQSQRPRLVLGDAQVRLIIAAGAPLPSRRRLAPLQAEIENWLEAQGLCCRISLRAISEAHA